MQLTTFRMLCLATALGAGCYTLTAQSDQRRLCREQLARAQATLIVDETNMKEATGRKFIDTYCDFKREIWALGPQVQAAESENASPEAAEKDETKHFAYHRKVQDIRQKYQEAFNRFLTHEQSLTVWNLEKEMMNHLAAMEW